jgi:hypothetical protein
MARCAGTQFFRRGCGEPLRRTAPSGAIRLFQSLERHDCFVELFPLPAKLRKWFREVHIQIQHPL